MLRHCTISELLELRDGGASVAVRDHVAECAACRDELERLHQRRAALRALPSVKPPRDRWSAVRDVYIAARRRGQRVRLLWGGLAAAAVVVLAIGVRAVTAPSAAARDAQPDIQALVQETQRLEDVLRVLQTERRVMDGYTASAVANLEDRIAALDAGISTAQNGRIAPQELRQLWRERVVLMDALVNTHVQRVAYVGF